VIVAAPKSPAVTPSVSAPPPTLQPAPATVNAPPFTPPAAEPLPRAPQPPAATKIPAQQLRRNPLPAPKIAVLRKRVIPIAIAGLLAIALFGTLLSRQNSQASQRKSAPPAATQSIPVTPAQAAPAVPVPIPIAVDSTPLPQPQSQTSAAAPVVEMKPPPEIILRGEVKSLWEAGRYAQALKLVDEILAENPAHAEARAWKKKIRAAQDAEAAIK
jgi:hypothetical protein